METLSFIAALVEALAWPLAIVFLLFLFRSRISELVSRITRISHNGTRIDLAPLQELPTQTAESIEIDERAQDAITRDPRAAVIEAWIRLEWAARDILQELGVVGYPKSPVQLIRTLQDRQLLQGSLYELLMELRQVRNMAAHELDMDIDAGYAREYVELTERAIASIRVNVGRSPVSSDIS